MSRRRLRFWISGCLGWLILYAGFYAYAEWSDWEPSAEILQTLIPMAIAIPIAFLAAGLNRRNSYLEALRDLWQQLIPSVRVAIQYTYLAEPDHKDFARTLRALSIAIDMLRGVFKNVPDKCSPDGLYPYENLKEIFEVVRWLSYGENFREGDAEKARQCIKDLWKEMHVAMLDEFDRDVPLKPVSKYLGTGKAVVDVLCR